MRKAVLTMLLLTAGCGPRPVNQKDISIPQAAEAMTRAGLTRQFTPGRWESEARLVNVTLAGAPPEAAEMLKRFTAAAALPPVCLTPNQPPPAVEATVPAEMRRDCSFKRFTATAGTVDALLVCQGWKGPRAISIELRGTLGPDHYSVTAVSRTQPNIGTKLSVTSQFDIRRRGPCLGDEIEGETRT